MSWEIIFKRGQEKTKKQETKKWDHIRYWKVPRKKITSDKEIQKTGRKLLGHTSMLPSALLVASCQGEVIIDAVSQAGCDLLSTAELSSQHLAICYKFIQSFTRYFPTKLHIKTYSCLISTLKHEVRISWKWGLGISVLGKFSRSFQCAAVSITVLIPRWHSEKTGVFERLLYIRRKLANSLPNCKSTNITTVTPLAMAVSMSFKSQTMF